MIFTPDMCDAILEERKTRTTRLIDLDTPEAAAAAGRTLVAFPCRYEVGSDYAIQPARNKKAVGRLRVLDVNGYANIFSIADDSVRGTRLADDHARLEGFERWDEFLHKWRELYGETKDDAPVWVIDFELVNG